MSTLDLWDDHLRKPLLDRHEQEELLERSAAGDRQARRILVERNLRLVVKTCLPYRGACDHRVSFDDLLQVAVIALQRAIDKYDPERGALSTIAVTYMKRDIGMTLAVGAQSLSMPRDVAVMYRVEYHRSGGQLTPEKVATTANISTTAATRLMQSRHPIYLDQPMTSGTDPEGRTVAERIGNPLEDDHAEECCEAMELRARLHAAMSGLTPRERKLLEMRYGIGRTKPATCREVADELGIDPSAVPALEQHVLDRARAGVEAAA